MVLVFPGLPDTRARLFLPVIKLRSDDFPTLDLPAKAISGTSAAGYCEALTATASSSDLLIFIMMTYLITTGMTSSKSSTGMNVMLFLTEYGMSSRSGTFSLGMIIFHFSMIVILQNIHLSLSLMLGKNNAMNS